MPVAGRDDDVTVGELARRLDDFMAEMRAQRAGMVIRELYMRDQEEISRRLDAHDRSLAALATNKRQLLYSLMAIVGSVAAAVIGALIASGGHL